MEKLPFIPKQILPQIKRQGFIQSIKFMDFMRNAKNKNHTLQK